MTRDVGRYLNARGTRGATVAPDGRLAFRADTTGTMQVWTLGEPGGWPTQQTFYDERVSFVDWSPSGDVIAFGKDTGADEHDQLYRLSPDDRTIVQLTDRPDAIHQWGAWSPDGDRVAFTANRRTTADFDVYVMAVDTGEGGTDHEGGADGSEPTRVCEGDGRISVVGWSPSGDRLLLRNAHASSDIDLSVVEVDSGERRHVTPHEDPARYSHPTFGPDGEAIYCVSDTFGDTTELIRIDLATLEAEPVTVDDQESDDWSVDEFGLDAATGRLAYARNVDGYSELFVGQLRTPTEADTVSVGVPDGVVSGLTIGPAGNRAAMTVSSTNLNYSIYTVELDTIDDTATPESERWTIPSSGGIPLEQYHEPDLIRYETFDDREIPAFFTLPDDYEEGETPVIVDIHGGPHSQRRPSWRNRPIRQYFLDAGYALFEPNVRGSSGYGSEYAALDDVEKRMDSVRDIAEGVEWLRDRPEIDADSIVCYGRSYGGFMVLACITEYPDIWAAAVDFVGISNWVTFLENTGDYRRPHREAEYGSLDADREFLESISPIHTVDQIACPLFVQHGANDPRVPVDEARQIADAVEEQGVPVETCIFEDEGHHTTKLENRIEQFERIDAFLDEHV
ncbi:peptidase S9 family protein (plasmid) [Natrialba magadii ATCC 43099]|uniref:Peptidase S9 family protein n=1 Tax=Natrialba magadii (strain ATCC 43099 / DSM 3394 / CCM 3739 / CIP 104546 / IAM 13178 / JCM 8861 / NBRC 102185 / NCIMB 2190 / MS3) TaxID=547559 RepID=D3T0V1_NATMM|nr:S9 family peptidase [Natrialba magadii]ADD07210.1 peptidase S9 family protein [Natrialba magadii ATCC 43099]ELY34324.1 peptidase S9 prolyl oligopeptidase active site domain-containing protein [Natrialba magadii ATCC 43099]